MSLLPFSTGVAESHTGGRLVCQKALLRFRKEDFGEIRHHGGLSPAWPIQYDDLEPYYTKAEQLYHVHGQRGVDPTEPKASAPMPEAALVRNSRRARRTMSSRRGSMVTPE